MQKVRDAIIDFQAACSQFGHQSAQGEVAVLDPLKQPQAVLARNLLWFVTAHLAGCYAPVARSRWHQLMAVLIATPNCFAARLHDRPPLTAPTTRFRRSIE